ncbi:MAG: ESX secretion-associated protein EspG [Mycolicibacterium sp.]|uniref:ESX secretion-associated protein EspG n=1 Tax=Mycolicibacterium sp. TaxID=2320850 RepID=UPI003D0A77AE
MSVSAAPVTEMTLSVSALLALQRVVGVSMLPAHLRVRPQLLRVSDQQLSITAEEAEVLIAAGLLDEGGRPDSDAATVVRALASGDAEINVTLEARDRATTYVCLVRRHELFVSAVRCGDDVVIDAFTGLNEHQVTALVAELMDRYVFDSHDDDPADIDRWSGPMTPIHEALQSQETASRGWADSLGDLGVPRGVATTLFHSETSWLARAEIGAYLNHEGSRSDPDTIVRVAATGIGAVMTSFASDNNRQRWLTVEPYEPERMERLISSAIRSVPLAAWFSHSRTD